MKIRKFVNVSTTLVIAFMLALMLTSYISYKDVQTSVKNEYKKIIMNEMNKNDKTDVDALKRKLDNVDMTKNNKTYITYLASILLVMGVIVFINKNFKNKLISPIEKLNDQIKDISMENFYHIDFSLSERGIEGDIKEVTQFKKSYLKLLEEIQVTAEEIEAQNMELEEINGELSFMSQKLEAVLESFSDIDKIGEDDFVSHCFEKVFSLIPEAEKGCYFILQDDYYIPKYAKGYDFEDIKDLKFEKNNVFDGRNHTLKGEIKASQYKVEQRRSELKNKNNKEILKNIGTYEDVYILYAPIKKNDEFFGMISLDNFGESGFCEASKRILRYYAQLISDFYGEMKYREKISETYMHVVEALASAIEVKDKYTEGHGKRVRFYSIEIAKAMKLSEEDVVKTDMAALLHDIGKIGVPSSIINKPGKLTDEEYEIIKKHPEYSKKILEKIKGFEDITEIVYSHHERIDGKGYPRGIRAEDIPLIAQIVQVADVYDALTSDRSYRKALDTEVAIDIIKEGIGTQFNAEIVNIAIKHVFRRA